MANFLTPFRRETSLAPGQNDFLGLWRDMDRLFDDFTRSVTKASPSDGGFLNPAVDVSETDKGIEIKAELPGVDQNSVDVELSDDNVLTIKAEKTFEKEEKQKQHHLTERAYGTFLRRFQLPFDADVSKTEASFDKGVLRVFVPRPPEAETKAKKIPLKGGEQQQPKK